MTTSPSPTASAASTPSRRVLITGGVLLLVGIVGAVLAGALPVFITWLTLSSETGSGASMSSTMQAIVGWVLLLCGLAMIVGVILLFVGIVQVIRRPKSTPAPPPGNA